MLAIIMIKINHIEYSYIQNVRFLIMVRYYELLRNRQLIYRIMFRILLRKIC